MPMCCSNMRTSGKRRRNRERGVRQGWVRDCLPNAEAEAAEEKCDFNRVWAKVRR